MLNDLIKIVRQVLQITPSNFLDRNSSLIGALPEFDSMAVVSILTALEEHYGFVIDDDEITADVFETVGSLVEFVEQKLEKN